MKYILLFVLLFPLHSCMELDEDGGYYDEKTKLYKYVDATRKGEKASKINLRPPIAGETQQIQGIVSRIGEDAKSIWIQIPSRQEYQIIAQALSAGNREDKTKQFKLTLEFISPAGSISSNARKRKLWRHFAIKVLKQQLTKKVILADIKYNEKARNLKAVIYKIVRTQNRDKIRNMNRWIIQEGLSYYFIDQGKAPQHKEYLKAQSYARHHKKGLWNR